MNWNKAGHFKGGLLLYASPHPLVFYIGCCACKRSSNLKKSQSQSCTKWSFSPPQKTLHLKCHVCRPAFNTVTLWHHYIRVMCLNDLCRCNCSAALQLLAVLAQVCVSWPIRGDWVYVRGGLMETGAKTECFRRRGNTELHHWTEWENGCVFLSNKESKPILAVTQNKITNLIMNIICHL